MYRALLGILLLAGIVNPHCSYNACRRTVFDNRDFNGSKSFKPVSVLKLEEKNVTGENPAILYGFDYSGNYRGTRCLKDIEKCMEEDNTHHKISKKLSNMLLTSYPPFQLGDVEGVSKECRLQSKHFIEDLKEFKFWALKMYDGGAKFPSGILHGNINQLGDFDMCVNSHSKERNIRGQYCLTNLEIEIPKSTYLSGLYQLIMAYDHIKTKIEDSGHRVPRFSSIMWAVCIPSVCTHEEVEKGLSKAIQKITEGTDLKIRQKVYPENCHAKDKWEVPISTYIALILFVGFISWLMFATLYHHWSFNPQNEWILAFSLKKNFDSLFTIKNNSNDIEVLHGIRWLNAVALIAAHKNMAMLFEPFSNRTGMVDEVASAISLVGRTASLYTEPFILISGILTAKSLLGKLDKTKKINLWEEYVSRLFRIVPSLAFLIFFCTFLMPWMSSGPMWNQVVTHHSHICKKNWWRNLLFIHNYFGFSNMCLTHTHHIGIDTQLFFLSPILVYVLWRWPKRGMITLTTIALASTIYRFYLTYVMQLSNYIHMSASTPQLFATADYSYTQPSHRLQVYVMGIFVGYLLKYSENVRLSQTALKIGNALAVACFCLSYFGFYNMGMKDYVYNPMDAALFGAIAPLLFCFAYSWLIITSELIGKGPLGRFFSWKIWKWWTKISYGVYLTQFPIYFYNVGRVRSSTTFSFFGTQYNIKEIMWIIFLSMLLTVMVEMPFQNVRDIFMKKKPTKKESGEVRHEKES
ncbi:unnamed protein product [Acanthoscelides obtectus]|uniref:Nose resistant-to-fluoxetine protein N-terminal domain-containing protein n=1 Tax=Acanthoscelides obtectus TaxID=200917 RepID=A0A9P0KII0_ACAOB|nr:unnamed protein product [Acanthoscelides obtectus]CAK1666740.1 Nose resistant to fluoxetine protein 6 [Acanthoscelides obtectus]